MSNPNATAKLQELIHRQDRVLTVMHPPSASLARVMETAGAEAGFVGTSGVVGAYTGMEDLGTATSTECVTIGGWIARAVDFPVILDGDTGHGGIMAVRRIVAESISAGLAGIRIDDQPIEAKRGTGSAGVAVESLDLVLTRYRAAVDCKRELDPNFVIMAQCYAGEAVNCGMEESLRRMKAYQEIGEVDWVQFSAPHSAEEIQQAREAISGPFSVMQSHLPTALTDDELLSMGVTIAWESRITHLVIYAALHDFMQDFTQRGSAAIKDFREAHRDNPYLSGALKIGGAEMNKLRQLEERYSNLSGD
ncbi:MAG: isocitrate lyase/PEP mutase family protein [Chloroflexi bacterium]|nr:isocitrate lyase/PEP mutase family protein [Chloroflexota bacterium]